MDEKGRKEKMSEPEYAGWNPRHGCTKYSEKRRCCYVQKRVPGSGSALNRREERIK